MKIVRTAALASVVALLSGCPKDKCKDVTCPTGQTCDSNSGTCVDGSGGSGGTGGAGGSAGSAGGGSAGGTVDAGTPIPLDMLCQKLAETECDKLQRCGRLAASERTICVNARVEQCALAGDVNAMVARYDPLAAGRCLAAVAQTDCADDSFPDVCDTAFVAGTGTAGAPCMSSGNCQADAGLYCKSLQSCGVCTAFSAAGQPCNSGTASRPATPCVAGLSCSNSTDGGVCMAPQPPGQACTTTASTTTNGIACQLDAGYCPPVPTDGGMRLCQPLGALGTRCTSTSSCGPSLFCNTAPDAGACESLRGVDQPCSASLPCQAGLYCPPVGTVPRNCRTLAADGQPCTFGGECASRYCNRDVFYYVDRGVNIEISDAGRQTCGFLTAGDECYINTDCGPGSTCNGLKQPRPDAGLLPGACAVQTPDGGNCVNSEFVVNDSCANPDATCLDGRCVVTPPFSRNAGEACDVLEQCKSPSYCLVEDVYTYEGHCSTAFKDAGEACDYNNPRECGPGNECNYDFNTEMDFCTPLPGAGESCSNDLLVSCKEYNDCVVTDAGAVCTPHATVGGMCSNTATGTSCYAAFCQVDAGVCAARQSPDAPCTSAAQCASGRCLNPDGGTSNRICIAACY